MFLDDAHLRLKKGLDILFRQADGLLDEGRTAMNIIADSARYGRGRWREQYRAESTDPVFKVLDALLSKPPTNSSRAKWQLLLQLQKKSGW